MREILYRSWNGKENKFYYFKNGQYYADEECKKWIQFIVAIAFFDWSNAQQFTGKTDKDGKKIFEGDIIEHGWFHYETGSSEDWFGTEPENSFNVVEAYPERIESVVSFVNGSFVLTYTFKSKQRIRCSLNSLFNNKDITEKVNACEEFESRYFADMLLDCEFKDKSELMEYLTKFEIIGFDKEASCSTEN